MCTPTANMRIDSEDDEEKEGVDEYGLPIGGEAAKFDVAAVPG
jgi:hypothetical protein